MQEAALPANEEARLRELRQYEMLDTDAEADIDDLTQLAACLCHAPIALVSLVDGHRQWFKSKVGLTVTETSRAIAFCSHSILQDGVFVVPDALADDRFADNPLVTGEPGIRFYAGAPLITPDGYRLGTLCVIDRQARQFDPDQQDILRALSRQVVRRFEQRRQLNALKWSTVERTQVVEALRQSEEQLRLVIHGVNDGIWDWNIVTRQKVTSARWKEILGYSEGELPDTDSSFFDLLHPDDRLGVQERLRQHLEERVPYAIEIRLRHKDGCYRWCLTRGEAMRDAQGKPVRMVGSLTDITARKEAEIVLRETEERWQYAFEGSGDGVWDWSAQTNKVFYSLRWKTMLGYEAHEIGDTLSEWESRVHSDDKAAVWEAIRKHFEGETDLYINEHRVLCKNGTYKWILDRGKVVTRDPQGKPLRVVGTHTDLTERKRMEEALRESHVELERRVAERTEKLAMAERQARQALNLLDATSDGVFIFDANSLRYSYVNQGALNQLGYTRDALLAMTPVEIKPEFDHDRFRALLAPLMAGKAAVVHFDTVHRRIDGVDVPVEINLQYVQIQDAVPCFVAIVRDITDRKHMEAMRQRHAVIDSVLQERESIMRNLHDGVLQSLYALRLGLEHSRRLLAVQPGKARESLDVQVEDLALMIAEVRRFMVGQDPVWAQAGTLREGLAVLIDGYRGTTAVDWQLELPDRDEEIAGLSQDEIRHLLYIVREAMSNVVRHASATRCRLALEPADECLQVIIEDNGLGFDPAASRRQGLGMGNMEARARQIGVALEILSAPGTGTRIVISKIRRITHVSI